MDIILNIQTDKKILLDKSNSAAGTADYPIFALYDKPEVQFNLKTLNSSGALTARSIDPAAKYILSITKRNDWSKATAPEIRVLSANFTIIDTVNGQISCIVPCTSDSFITLMGDKETDDGGIELVELIADGSPVNSQISDVGGIAAGLITINVPDASAMKIGDHVNIIEPVQSETVIIKSINGNELTISGTGINYGTFYSHAENTVLVIQTFTENVLCQSYCRFQGRRDGYGDGPTETPELFVKMAELLSLLIVGGYSKTYPPGDPLVFTKADVDSGTKLLSVNHALGQKWGLAVSIDSEDLGERIRLDKIIPVDDNNLNIDCTNWYDDMTGNYHLKIRK